MITEEAQLRRSAQRSDLPASLIKVYTDTLYRVNAKPPFTLRIGEYCAAANRQHMLHGVETSAFITACNPFSQILSDADNHDRQQQLRQDLTLGGRLIISGFGYQPFSEWPGEDSFYLPGLTFDEAMNLCRRYLQNAFVFLDKTAVPDLFFLR